MRILYVCTANICRSPSAQQLLRESVSEAPALSHVEVLSAGTDAIRGARGCLVAPALAGHAQVHCSQPITADLVEWADLILSAGREHRPAIVALDLHSRSRTFTIRQVGRIADWLLAAGVVDAARERAGSSGGWTDAEAEAQWAARFAIGDPRREVEPMPVRLDETTGWLIREMDSARGMPVVPMAFAALPGGQRRRFWPSRSLRRKPEDAAASSAGFGVGSAALASRPTSDVRGAHWDDVPDPHILGEALHSPVHEQIRMATDSLGRLLRAVAQPM